MANRNHQAFIRQNRYKDNSHGKYQLRKQPFWLPAISYYFLTIAVALIIFLLIWAILHEGGDETPWIAAGIFSGIVLMGSVFLREVYLKKERKKYLAAKRQLDYNLRKVKNSNSATPQQPKFTLQQNTYLMNQIQEKSNAAKILKRLPEGHREVIEICVEYLNFTNQELRRTDPNSPRFTVIRKTRNKVKHLHKFHLLVWTELETKNLTSKAGNEILISEKIETAQKALNILDSTLKFYPNEIKLIESSEAVLEFIAKVKMNYRIEQAEKTAFNGNITDAVGQYKDILFFISKENFPQREKQDLEENILLKVRKLQNEVKAENNLDNSREILNGGTE